MEDVTKDILSFLGNTHTKVELKEDFKGNYYSYLTDTVYIAKSFGSNEEPSNINKKAAELVVVCHECIHSVQSKFMHMLNTFFSNLSIILVIICIVLGLFWTSPLWLKITTCTIIAISIIIRLILELGAINGSINLAAHVVSKDMIPDISKQDIEDSTKYIDKHKYIALLRMVADKIIFLILGLVIK